MSQRDWVMTEGLLDTNKICTHTVTQGYCPTPQTSPTDIAMNATAAAPAKPH